MGKACSRHQAAAPAAEAATEDVVLKVEPSPASAVLNVAPSPALASSSSPARGRVLRAESLERLDSEDFASGEGSPDEKVAFLLRLLQETSRGKIDVSVRCLDKLSVLCEASSANRQAALRRGALESAVRLMRVHSDHSTVQSSGCAAIAGLAPGSGGGVDRFRPALEVVIAAMQHASDRA